MKRAHWKVLLGTTSWLMLAPPVQASQGRDTPQAPSEDDGPRDLEVSRTARSGDFDRLFETRNIRVLIPYSRTLFFTDKGRERGISAETVREFEAYLNKKYRKQLNRRPLTITLIATTRDRLLDDVAKGFGDIAVGNLTVTPQRQVIVDFVAPHDATKVSELLITGPKAASIASVSDLAGRTVHVRPASSYHESLIALSDSLVRVGKPPIDITTVPDALEDEDMMEMVNAGIIEATVVDDWKARIWAQVLPKLVVREDVVLRREGRVGWAIRKGSPLLEAEILSFYTGHLQGTGRIQARVAKFHKRIKQIQDPTRSQEWKRFQATVDLFEKYGSKYNFDPLMLVAQGYQESCLDQNARSPVGAVGVMQIMPETGAELNVGDIGIAECNIHAGTKYMDQLMTRYFPDARFDEANRVFFAFASYNAGPGRISSMRKLAVKRGLDPDQWFNNVEIVVAEKVGWETTTYVRNILKYYAAYKLTLEAKAAQEKARMKVTEGGR